jgi:hypothetical protein
MGTKNIGVGDSRQNLIGHVGDSIFLALANNAKRDTLHAAGKHQPHIIKTIPCRGPCWKESNTDSKASPQPVCKKFVVAFFIAGCVIQCWHLASTQVAKNCDSILQIKVEGIHNVGPIMDATMQRKCFDVNTTTSDENVGVPEV